MFCYVCAVSCVVMWCVCMYVLNIEGHYRLSYLLQMSPSQTARVLVSVLDETVAAFDEDTTVDSTDIGVR